MKCILFTLLVVLVLYHAEAKPSLGDNLKAFDGAALMRAIRKLVDQNGAGAGKGQGADIGCKKKCKEALDFMKDETPDAFQLSALDSLSTTILLEIRLGLLDVIENPPSIDKIREEYGQHFDTIDNDIYKEILHYTDCYVRFMFPHVDDLLRRGGETIPAASFPSCEADSLLLNQITTRKRTLRGGTSMVQTVRRVLSQQPGNGKGPKGDLGCKKQCKVAIEAMKKEQPDAFELGVLDSVPSGILLQIRNELVNIIDNPPSIETIREQYQQHFDTIDNDIYLAILHYTDCYVRFMLPHVDEILSNADEAVQPASLPTCEADNLLLAETPVERTLDAGIVTRTVRKVLSQSGGGPKGENLKRLHEASEKAATKAALKKRLLQFLGTLNTEQ